MTWKEAIKYCEEADSCENCPSDSRTDYEKDVLHFPCCICLVDKELLDKEREKGNKNETLD